MTCYHGKMELPQNVTIRSQHLAPDEKYPSPGGSMVGVVHRLEFSLAGTLEVDTTTSTDWYHRILYRRLRQLAAESPARSLHSVYDASGWIPLPDNMSHQFGCVYSFHHSPIHGNEPNPQLRVFTDAPRTNTEGLSPVATQQRLLRLGCQALRLASISALRDPHTNRFHMWQLSAQQLEGINFNHPGT